MAINKIDVASSWRWAAIIALVAGIGQRLTLSWRWSVIWLAVTVLSLLPVAATGHASGSTAHDLATNSLIIHLFSAAFYVGGLVAVIIHTMRGGTRVALALRRYSVVATVAIVALGFTLAVALGSPLGTGLAEIASWRVAIGGLAVLGAVLGLGMARLLVGMPTNARVPLSARIGVLADPRVVMGIIAIMMMILSFNLIYVFSSEVTAGVTGDDGGILALLLLVFGLSGAVGNQLGGWIVDTWGNMQTMRFALVIEISAFLLMLVSLDSLVATAFVFAVWGASGFASVVALQDRLASLHPDRTAIILSWYSTGMYVGISIAPVIGAMVLAGPGHLGLPIAAALAAAVALAMTVPVRART